MHILMDKDANPHQEVVAQQIPLRNKPQTELVVNDLINKIVITKAQKATKWVGVGFVTLRYRFRDYTLHVLCML